MATVTLPGGPTLSYREWGRPDGAVVLLLHGLSSSSASWRHVGPVLGRRFRCIAPDARGHGESEWAAEYSLDLLCADVVGLMDQLGILAAIPYGHSMGALTAYQLAATHPDLVRMLVLEDMPPPDPAQPRRPDPSPARSRRRPRLAGGHRRQPVAQRTLAGMVGATRTGSARRPSSSAGSAATCPSRRSATSPSVSRTGATSPWTSGTRCTSSVPARC